MVRGCWDPACRFARTLLGRGGAGPGAEPQDLVQDGLAKFLEKPAPVRSTTHFFQSLKHFIRFTALNARRVACAAKRGRSRPAVSLESAEEQAACPDPGPLTDLLQRDQKQALLGALARLEPQERSLIHLAYWERRPLHEIARELGLACPSEARRRLIKALDRLRRGLEPAPGPG